MNLFDIGLIIINIIIIGGLTSFIAFTSIYEYRYYKQLKEEKDGIL